MISLLSLIRFAIAKLTKNMYYCQEAHQPLQRPPRRRQRPQQRVVGALQFHPVDPLVNFILSFLFEMPIE